MTKLGNFIKGYRIDHSLSLRNFATLSGLSHTYIEKLEKGVNRKSGKPLVPTIETMQAIAKATGKTLLEILQVSGYIPNTPTLKQGDAVKETSDTFPEDPELKDFWDQMVKRNELQILLKQVKDLSPEAIGRLIKYIHFVEDEETQY